MRFFLLLVGGVFVRVYLQGRHTRTARFVFFFWWRTEIIRRWFLFCFWFLDRRPEEPKESVVEHGLFRMCLHIELRQYLASILKK